MQKKMIVVSFVLTFLLMLASGCTPRNMVIDISMDAPDNPQSGKLVVIKEVIDNRVFEVKSTDVKIPTLRNAEELQDETLKSRALGKLWTGGNSLLPEGKNVCGLISDLATKALRESGYRVVDSGDSMANGAMPVSIEIDEYWTWTVAGFWAVRFTCEIKFEINGEMIKGGSVEIGGTHGIASPMLTIAQWHRVINTSMDVAVEKLKENIKQ